MLMSKSSTVECQLWPYYQPSTALNRQGEAVVAFDCRTDWAFRKALEMQIPDDCRPVRRWYDQMQKRESVRKSLPTHLPDGSPMPLAA